LKTFLALAALSLCRVATAAEVSWGAAESNGVGLADGTDLPAECLVRVGNFSISDADIRSNAGNRAFLEANFIEFGRAAVGDGNVAGDGIRHSAHWYANSTNSTQSLGINGKRIYYWVFDAPGSGTPTQQGIYTAPASGAWMFRDDNTIPNSTVTDIKNVPQDGSGIIVGTFGVGTSDLSGEPHYNLAAIPGVAPTPTPSATPTPTATATPTPTVTPTATPTPTISPSPSPSASPTASPSPSATSSPTASPSPSPRPASHLANISTRLRVGTADNVLIAGFILQGTGEKRLIVRGTGPSLDIAGRLMDPVLELYDGENNKLAENDRWQEDENAAEALESTVAPTDPNEPALLRRLLSTDTAFYTAVVTGKNGTTGIGLVEVYDLDQNGPVQIVNIATRGFVQTGNNAMIGGVIVTGEAEAEVVIRAIGPSLGEAVDNKLADPVLGLFNDDGQLIFANDDWKADQEETIKASGLAPQNDKESAIRISLKPGNYTAIVRGKNDSTGVAVVEVYKLSQ
jgi:hypothetical protein